MTVVCASNDRVPGLIAALSGIGLRFPHHKAVIEQRPRVSWFEIHTENYMGGGAPLRHLETIRRDYPVSLHGVGLSLGCADGLDAAHLDRIVRLADRMDPGLVSEHLSWSISDGHYLGDLLPLPLTEEAIDIVCCNIDRFQNALRRQILVENPSSYLRYHHSTIPENEFLVTVARRTGCGILCDVNNIFVSASNLGWNAQSYLSALPPAMVKELHLGGHAVKPLAEGAVLRIDDHGSHVNPAVWDLFRATVQHFGPLPTLIEWDTNIPPLETLIEQADLASAILLEPRRAPANADAA
jgi:uncharacterized protein (UPF0276 family)